MRQLFIKALTEDSCLTHDGIMQLGYHNHSVEKHKTLNPEIDWQEVYWAPDVFAKRYKSVSFQKHLKCNEGSPKTDNASNSRPRDFPSLSDS
jgi:hypothetical protein